MSYQENDKLEVSFKEENCDIVQNDIVTGSDNRNMSAKYL